MSWRPKWWLEVLRIYWPLNHLAARATGIPVIGRIITVITSPLFSDKNFNITYIPVNANIEPAASEVLSRGIIEELIRKSAHRVIIKKCSCRDSKGCKNYPAEDSCLLLGYDTEFVSPCIARHVGVDEAVWHMNSMISKGLVPLTGRVRMDDFFYGVPNRGRMLTICFCCPCCCTILNSARFFPNKFRSGIVKLRGARIVIDANKCKTCGTCIDSCFMKAIFLENGIIKHDHEKCIGCGRCTVVCPEKASVVAMDNAGTAVDEILGRIKHRVNVE
ncbi:MAG: DUF362 domain-containing protein [Smithella sp.]